MQWTWRKALVESNEYLKQWTPLCANDNNAVDNKKRRRFWCRTAINMNIDDGWSTIFLLPCTFRNRTQQYWTTNKYFIRFLLAIETLKITMKGEWGGARNMRLKKNHTHTRHSHRHRQGGMVHGKKRTSLTWFYYLRFELASLKFCFDYGLFIFRSQRKRVIIAGYGRVLSTIFNLNPNMKVHNPVVISDNEPEMTYYRWPHLANMEHLRIDYKCNTLYRINLLCKPFFFYCTHYCCWYDNHIDKRVVICTRRITTFSFSASLSPYPHPLPHTFSYICSKIKVRTNYRWIPMNMPPQQTTDWATCNSVYNRSIILISMSCFHVCLIAYAFAGSQLKKQKYAKLLEIHSV